MSTITSPGPNPDSLVVGTDWVVPAPATREGAAEVRDGNDDPRWTRPALFVLLGATGLLYLWGLGASGWANSFYSAAAQASSVSWKAWFFGSSDAANAITVDKPPMALWLMGLSARVFGVNAWAILVPQALAGVASVGVLYATVRRWFGPVAGLIAGAVLATTPVATLMFRFNNPDALLVLLLTGAAWCLVRAIETTSTRWVVACWALVGCGFLTKMLQAFLVAPAFALVYLVVADTTLRRRIVQSVVGFVTLIVSAGWYVAVVEAWPTGSRPYIGGSQNNSLLELTLGYNGLGRLTGNETGSAQNGGNWGATGWNRLFNHEFGSQASWLIPTAVILLVAGLWWTRRARRFDRTRAALAIWGGWFLVTAAAFSFGAGIIHPYYTVALAPAIAALVAIGCTLAWQRRHTWLGRLVCAASVVSSVVWAWVLLGRAEWLEWLAPAVAVTGGVTAVAILAMGRLPGRVAPVIAVAAVLTGLAGPVAYSLQTASTTHSGALPSAGPSQGGGFGPGGRGGARMPGGGPGGFGAPPPGLGSTRSGPPNAAIGGGTMSPGGLGRPPGGFTPPGGTQGRVPGASRGGGAGGLLSASTSTPAVTAKLRHNADSFRWAAATVGSNSASGFQLASGRPVMAIGGFNGSDPFPTLARFERYVANGDIHWFIAGGAMGGGAGPGARGGQGTGSSTSQAITEWVEANFTPTTVDGVTLYDLTAKRTDV